MEDSRPFNGVVSANNKFFKRLLAKEEQTGCSSRALYYAAPAAIPFDWESEPGTPKHRLNFEEDKLGFAIAPLSPPPFLQATAAGPSPSSVSDSSSHDPPRKLSDKISGSNLSRKLSGALQTMKEKVKRLRSQHKVHAQIPQDDEERCIGRKRSKSYKMKSNSKVEVICHWVPFNLKKVLFI